LGHAWGWSADEGRVGDDVLGHARGWSADEGRVGDEVLGHAWGWSADEGRVGDEVLGHARGWSADEGRVGDEGGTEGRKSAKISLFYKSCSFALCPYPVRRSENSWHWLSRELRTA